MNNFGRDSLGDRMKIFEGLGQATELDPLDPILIRLDGRAFHTYTRGLEKPFDVVLTQLMQDLTKELVRETNALVAYHQSDEIQLLLYNPNPKGIPYFGGRRNKIDSVLASLAGSYFNHHSPWKTKGFALFDCRCWNVPTKEEAVNAFLWRFQDCVRNSIQCAGQAHYSHNQLHGKDTREILEMLKVKGINWEEYHSSFKYGTFLVREKSSRPLSQEELEHLPEKHHARTNPELLIERWTSKKVSVNFQELENKGEFIFGKDY